MDEGNTSPRPASDPSPVVSLPDRPDGSYILAFEAMGTRFEFLLIGDDTTALRLAADEAAQDVRSLHDRLTVFSPGSVISRLNERAALGPVHVSRDVLDLLLACRRYHDETGGVFDPTIGPLMTLWGFRRRGNDGWAPPTPADVARSLDVIGMDRVRLDEDEQTVEFATRGVQLDLGSIAKGHALDVAAGVLRAHGVGRAFLHGGTSSIVALGGPTDPPFVVEVAGPPAFGSIPVYLVNGAMAVSAPHGRVVDVDGFPHGHVIDPRTGRPAHGALTAVAIGKSAAACDAWSTALLVLGERPANAPSWLGAAVLAFNGWTMHGGTPPRSTP